MPRDLADVLHYFLPDIEPTPPEAERAAEPTPARAEPTGTAQVPYASDAAVALEPAADAVWNDAMEARPRPSPVARPTALPILAVPIGDRDVVRAAFAWNLAVEIARDGGRAVLVAPVSEPDSPLWPQPGVGPLGAELVLSDARDLGALHRAALDLAVSRAAQAEHGGVVLVRIPPAWLIKAAECRSLLRWSLLLSAPQRPDLLETYGLAKLLFAIDPEAEIGVTIHGARDVAEARDAYQRLARATRRHLDRDLSSFGLLVDDLQVYRAIVARRPIGLSQPQSSAARALRDVACMLQASARSHALV